MIMLIRWLLLPISLLYQAVVWTRNWLYDHDILQSKSFDIPTIAVGNLAIGGAGKSPMTELITRLLKENYKLAILSRGYGRKTKGFKYVETNSTALEVGDEPLQFKKKFPEITVSVCEDRCAGIATLEANHDVILLDDAYQHRRLKAGYNILLFDFNSLFQPLLTLPTGNFRDILSSSKRADIIVISKSPQHISDYQKQHITDLLNRYTKAPIYYSYIQYEKPKNLHAETSNLTLQNLDIILFCGVANPFPLKNYLSELGNSVTLMRYADHHNYSTKDMHTICAKYDSTVAEHKLILTTEKDMQRVDKKVFKGYPVYYIPITTKISSDQDFNQHILEYVSQVVKK